jgi:16S rRNA (cytidine1402-2'-O)-methyltransferase
LSVESKADGRAGHADAASKLLAAVERDLARSVDEDLPPGLYLVATPIGNLGDITLRALSILLRADIVYCEDTRHSARLLQHFSIRATTRPLHDHNEESEQARVLRDLESGKRIALISDAGTPLISDPGFKLVRECARAGCAVFCIPGASSTIAAVATSGLPTDAFFFAGFLPPKQASRRARLTALKSIPGTLIFFESPQRTSDSLADMADILGDREAVMARELTKLHEEVLRGPLSVLAVDLKLRDLKGEVVLLVASNAEIDVSDDDIATRLETLMQTMSLKDAAKAVADAFSVSKTRVYDIGLKIRERP